MKHWILAILLLGAAFSQTTAQNTPVNLWENGAPNAKGNASEDVPAIMPFLAPKETTTGTAILVCPGGGYARLSDVKEGSKVAEWLNSLGISAFVLKYRLGPKYNQPNQLLDAARALRMIRARAKEWNLDEKRIGILGFSAGGHLASTLATKFDSGNPNAKDAIEKISSRPDLQILIYPVISMGEFTHQGSKKNLLGENPTAELINKYSNELQITKETPPAFVVHTMTDAGVPVENSMMYVSALRKNNVPFEFHLYEQGPHGFGLGTNDYLKSWAARCADWLELRGFLKPKNTVTAK